MKTACRTSPRNLEPVSIEGIAAFQTLEPAQRQALTKKLYRMEFEPGDTIVSRADPTSEVYFLISGRVRALSSTIDGKEIQFEDLDVGEVFGELAALDGGGRSGECIAITQSVVAVLSQDDFLCCIDNYRGLNRYVMTRLTSIVRNQLERVVEFSAHTAKDRLRCELVRLAVRHGEPVNGKIIITNPPTHSDLASRIGSQRPAVSRELQRLHRLGLITWSRTEHTINDLQALQISITNFKPVTDAD